MFWRAAKQMGLGEKGVPIVTAIGHQLVQAGRMDEVIACGSDGVDALLVGHEQQDVGPIVRLWLGQLMHAKGTCLD